MTRINSTSAFFKEVRKRLEKPEHWIKGAMAKTEAGVKLYEGDPAAKCFCIIGAMRNVYLRGGASEEVYHKAKEFFRTQIGGVHVVKWNDSVDHKMLLKTLDKAILKAAA